MKSNEKLSKDTHQLVTAKQLEEAYNDKNVRKFIFFAGTLSLPTPKDSREVI